MPLIVADPSRPGGHGTRSRALVELVDLLPTLGHLGGLSRVTVVGPPLSGVSLVPLLGGPGDGPDGGRAAAVTQFVRCPVSPPGGKAGKAGQDFRLGITSAIHHGCVRDRRGCGWPP